MTPPLDTYPALKVAALCYAEQAAAASGRFRNDLFEAIADTPDELVHTFPVLLSALTLHADAERLRGEVGDALAQLPPREPRLKPLLQAAADITRDLYGEQYKLALPRIAETAGIPASEKPSAYSGDQLRRFFDILAGLVCEPDKRAAMLPAEPPTEASGDEHPALMETTV